MSEILYVAAEPHVVAMLNLIVQRIIGELNEKADAEAEWCKPGPWTDWATMTDAYTIGKAQGESNAYRAAAELIRNTLLNGGENVPKEERT